MIILASKSPRRKELMTSYITSHFSIIPSSYEEEVSSDLSPIENVMIISKRKGEDVFKDHKDDIVISSDTIVVLNNKIYGKPSSHLEAKKMLNELSDKTHEVITAYWIFSKEKIISNYVVSKVTFNKLSDELIENYIATGSPFDEAGGYGIQDEYGHLLVKHYEGSLNNIIGFPVEEIKKDLEGLKMFEI